MHRQTQYAYEVPAETDFLYASRFAYEGLGLLAMDLLGTTTLVAGLACTPTGPASMSVQIGPGRIYSKQNLEDTAWGLFNSIGGLAADTSADHQILKQGLFRDTTVLATMAAPGTTGQSINYLIEAAFSEVDAIPISLPFVSATSPYPPIAPSTLNTVRQDKCVITVKAGTAATTGSQATPAVDSGNVGLWVVTVANGATSITSGNISAYTSAPFLAGLTSSHHGGVPGQAPKVNLASEVQGVLPASMVSGIRMKLAADTTYYVSTTGTDDASHGTSTGTGAFRTIAYAYAFLQQNLDLGGYQLSIVPSAGAYNNAIIASGQFVGQRSPVIIAGTSVSITTASGVDCINAQNGASITISGLTLATVSTGSAACVTCQGGSVVNIGANMVFGQGGTNGQLYASSGTINLLANYTNTIGGNSHWFAEAGGNIKPTVAITVTNTATPAYTGGFAIAQDCGSLTGLALVTFSGGASGVRYQAVMSGVINTGGAGSTFIPGSSSGTTSFGGQYN